MRISVQLCVLSLVILNGCCAIKTETLIKDIFDSIADFERERYAPPDAWMGISFRDTELYGFFTKYEPPASLASVEPYPRVALTVLDVPPNHFREFDNTKSCWTLSAKIWQSKDISDPRFVEPFHWCSPRDLMPDTVPLDSVHFWRSLTDVTSRVGPELPESLLPTDLKHLEFWRSDTFDRESMNMRMLSSLLYHMGFDWTNYADRRVWVVEFVQARWASP